MINVKFVKSQFRSIRLPAIILLIVLIILLIPALAQDFIVPTVKIVTKLDSFTSFFSVGAGQKISNIYFGFPGFIVLFVFAIIFSYRLRSKKISQQYFSSWSSSMSKRIILNSKIFVLLSTMVLVYSIVLVFQLALFSIKFLDFNIQNITYLLLINFGFILLVLLWTSIVWIFFCIFNNLIKSLILSLLVSTIFVIFAILPLFYSNSEFYWFKYLTITTLLNSPFKYPEFPEVINHPLLFLMPNTSIIIINDNTLPLNIKDFDWQFPVMFFSSCCFFSLSYLFLLKKDLSYKAIKKS